jgi:hypothetical protein
MEKTKNISKIREVNPYFYGGLMMVTAVHWVIYKDLMNGAIAFNLALAFDPFNQNQKWEDRPLWQKGWLVVHVTIGIGLIVGLGVMKVLGK